MPCSSDSAVALTGPATKLSPLESVVVILIVADGPEPDRVVVSVTVPISVLLLMAAVEPRLDVSGRVLAPGEFG